MADREKVIKALDCCEDMHRAGPGWAQGCIACPYAEQEKCHLQLTIDAKKLLKEQGDKPVLDEFGRCFVNALKRQLEMNLQMIEMLISPDFAEKIVELIENIFD